MSQNYDHKDAEIMRILQRDARTTIKELAGQISLSPSPTFDRQKRLEREGYIKGYVAVVDPKKTGNNLIVITYVRLKEQSHRVAVNFCDAINRMPEVTECYSISGDFDFMLKIYLRDMDHYQDMVCNQLSLIPGVANIRSSFVIHERKHTFALPVLEEGMTDQERRAEYARLDFGAYI